MPTCWPQWGLSAGCGSCGFPYRRIPKVLLLGHRNGVFVEKELSANEGAATLHK
jgi:hypothetical protein